MSSQRQLSTLERILFEDGDQRLYGILDGAVIPNLQTLLVQHEVLNVCILPGVSDPKLVQAAPYLVELTPQSPFTRLMLSEGIGNHWGILAHSDDTMLNLRIHFRNLLTVWDANGKPLHFRYYDPRILREFLPTCDAEELGPFFGPVTNYFAEADVADKLWRFVFTGEKLGQLQLTLSWNQSAPMET